MEATAVQCRIEIVRVNRIEVVADAIGSGPVEEPVKDMLLPFKQQFCPFWRWCSACKASSLEACSASARWYRRNV